MKIYPSSAAFAQGQQVITEHNNSCLRWQLVNRLAEFNTRKDIPKLYAAVADIDEERFKHVLQARHKEIQQEVPFKRPIAGTEGVLRGRIDFIADGIVYEKKSTFNPKAATDIRQKRIKPGQLAQLLTYLQVMKTSVGYLAATAYKFDKGLQNLQVVAEHEYKVELREGKVYVDEVLHEYTLHHLAQYYRLAANNSGKDIPSMPRNWFDDYKGPCGFCPLKQTCLKYEEKTLDKQGYLNEANQVLFNYVNTKDTRKVSIPAAKR